MSIVTGRNPNSSYLFPPTQEWLTTKWTEYPFPEHTTAAHQSRMTLWSFNGLHKLEAFSSC